jgi:hypothetical protein
LKYELTDELGQVYGYSRRFAEIGVAEVLVNALREQVAPSSLPSACAALKSIAVNVSFAMLSTLSCSSFSLIRKITY